MTLAEKPAASVPAAAAAIAALGAVATAFWVSSRARQAEREHLPRGAFIEVEGTRLHYVERGAGPAVVLLHGNAVSLEDFESSGLIAALARHHRVVAFDRPGFGHSDRPRDRLWTPEAQAEVLQSAMARLGLQKATLIGHSMGTVVALAMAIKRPRAVAGLILLGGYYYPTMRLDALLAVPAALPIFGDVLRYTVGALSARALLGASVKGMFSPVEVPTGFFSAVSREMMLRPGQLRADLEDGVYLVPAARANARCYAELLMPVTIIAGATDKIVDPQSQSVRLHDDIPQSELLVMPAVGHMVHYAAVELIASLAAAMVSGEPSANELVLEGAG